MFGGKKGSELGPVSDGTGLPQFTRGRKYLFQICHTLCSISDSKKVNVTTFSHFHHELRRFNIVIL